MLPPPPKKIFGLPSWILDFLRPFGNYCASEMRSLLSIVHKNAHNFKTTTQKCLTRKILFPKKMQFWLNVCPFSFANRIFSLRHLIFISFPSSHLTSPPLSSQSIVLCIIYTPFFVTNQAIFNVYVYLNGKLSIAYLRILILREIYKNSEKSDLN